MGNRCYSDLAFIDVRFESDGWEGRGVELDDGT